MRQKFHPSISSQEELDVTKIEKGEYSIVFGSPEAWLMNDRRGGALRDDTKKGCVAD